MVFRKGGIGRPEWMLAGGGVMWTTTVWDRDKLCAGGEGQWVLLARFIRGGCLARSLREPEELARLLCIMSFRGREHGVHAAGGVNLRL